MDNIDFLSDYENIKQYLEKHQECSEKKALLGIAEQIQRDLSNNEDYKTILEKIHLGISDLTMKLTISGSIVPVKFKELLNV